MRAGWASQDRQGLQDAIWTWMTRSAEQPGADMARRRQKKIQIAYAFELWIRHLALIESLLELAPGDWDQLRATEMEGLLMMRGARERYAREYRACEQCGMVMKGRICPRCGALSESQ